MSNARRLMGNTLFLTTGGIIMRGIELCFRAYLAVRIGAESMGVYGLVMSAYMVFSTIGVSGIRFCTTRLCAEAKGRGNLYPVKLMHKAFLYSLFFGLLSGGVMLGFSGQIASSWIGEAHTGEAVRILALSLPPMALQAAISGYFTGKEKIFRLVAVQFLDSAVRIAVTVCGFSVHGGKNVCTVLASGETAGEVASAFVILLLYICDICGKRSFADKERYGRRILTTALPLAVSAYTRTGLSSLGHMLVPIGLRKSGIDKAGAFAAYGVIHQMAFPVILFPAALLAALGEVLIPLFTSAQVCGRKMGISYMANRALRMGLIFSMGIAGLMYMGADDLSIMFYKSADAGKYIRLFSFLIPVMYLDSVTDGCLKGLGQQMYSMAVNIADAFLNVVLLYFLLPEYAANGYVVTVFICEIMNFVLSIGRLCRITQIDANVRVTVTAALSAAMAQWVGDSFGIYGLAVKAAVFLIVYLGLLYVGNGASRDDFKWLKRLYFEKNV